MSQVSKGPGCSYVAHNGRSTAVERVLYDGQSDFDSLIGALIHIVAYTIT